MLILTDIQKVALSVAAVDAAGNPAALDGAPTWSSSDPAIVTVTGSEDGMSAVVESTGTLGQAQVTVTADARIGEEQVLLAGTMDFTVIASEAVSLAVTAGAPEPK